MSDYLISVDIGTQGTKAALFDREISMIDSAFVPSTLHSPKPGVVWQEPDEMLAECCLALNTLMQKTGADPLRVAGIGLDGQMAGIMGIDDDGQASTPYDSWLDMRCGPQMKRMNDRAGKRIIQLSGGPATYVHGPKILWWKENHPEAFRNTAKFVLPHTFIAGRLCGLDAEASYFDYTHLHFSCLADTANKRWSEELLDTFDIDKAKMARIISPFEVIGRLGQAMAERCGLAAGIPLVAGCGDTAASTFGTGMFQSGMLLDCAGTASVLCSVVDSYIPDVRYETLAMMRSPVDGLFLPLAYVNGGGMCIRWFRNQLTGNPHSSYEELQLEAEVLPPGSEGLMFIPHFSGRVLPNNPNLKGAYLGLDFKHTRGHMYRAVLEAIAYEYAYYLSVLKGLYPHEAFDRMLIVGGGAESPLFNQIKADVLDVHAATLQTGETALIGSAVIAGVGVGLLKGYTAPILAAIRQKGEYAPNPGRHQAYQPYCDAYLSALEAGSAYYAKHPLA
jgi:xylulokinase